MYESKLRGILRKVKNENPETRHEALGQLFQLKQEEGMEIQMDVLKDMIKTAASPFPERVDNWDNPSYYLIDFVCDFPQPEVIDGLIKHFDGFDIQAKERAIEVLLLTEEEEIFYFLEEKIIGLMQTEDFLIPYRELTSYPMLIKGILDTTLEKLDFKNYKFAIYDMLLSLNTAGVEQGYRKEVVLPILLKDYQAEKLEYLKFNQDYTTKYVYTAWKDSYLIVRSRMRLFLHLMEFYFSTEIAQELQEALDFLDPFLKTEAILVCISKNLPYEKGTLLQCAEDIETAEMVYWELKDKNLEYLYPIKEAKQPHLAKTRLFSTIINLPEEEDGVIRYPEDIEIIDKVDTENAYGQPLRYYLLKFSEHNVVYAGWAGGYALEDGDDTANLWDGSYTDFVEFTSANIEGHKQQFLQKRAEEIEEYENSVFYESSPRLSRGAWFFLALLITHWARELFTGFNNGTILISVLFTVIGGGFCLYEVAKNKKRKIMIIGKQLVKTDGTKQNSIGMSQIKKVSYDNKHVLVYNLKNELAFKFPKKWVRYELFYLYMKEHTGHLNNSPFIQS